MRVRELFSHYRQRVEAMAAEQAPLPVWPGDLGEILRLEEIAHRGWRSSSLPEQNRT
jgi:hypothetical protein